MTAMMEPEATEHFMSFLEQPSHSLEFDAMMPSMSGMHHEMMIPSATITKPNVMTIDQLDPSASNKMEMPMMMPMPLTTALHNQMSKGMKAMTSFMNQLPMMMPQMPQMPSMGGLHSQPSPCGGMSMSMPQMQSPKPDIMSLIRQLTDQLSPMNMLNNLTSMMKGTQMAMGMGQQMSQSPCMSGGD